MNIILQLLLPVLLVLAARPGGLHAQAADAPLSVMWQQRPQRLLHPPGPVFAHCIRKIQLRIQQRLRQPSLQEEPQWSHEQLLELQKREVENIIFFRLFCFY